MAVSLTRRSIGWQRWNRFGPIRTLYTDLDFVPEKLSEDVKIHSARSQTTLTMNQLLQLKGVPFAQFLHKELPVRLARRVVELENLPYGLSAMPSVQKVHSWYESTFEELRSTPLPSNANDTERFKVALEKVLTRHNDVVPTLAKGLIELKKTLGVSEEKIVDRCPFLQDFLDRFFLARIGIRTLIGQYVAVHSDRPGFIGLFEKDCKVRSVIEYAADDAGLICSRQYGVRPEVVIKGTLDLHLTYMPGHIHHICFELIKNSMRAIVENPKFKSQGVFPAVEIVIAEGEDDIAIKISDQGGGIPRNDMRKIFGYAYTTVKDPPDITSGTSQPQLAGLTHVPMAGYGYGLPLSRIYSHVFGGDLIILSMHGYGTDAYLYLNKLHQSTEIVPR
jgi:pyruvate dehydrogenase kinase 2/3/4